MKTRGVGMNKTIPGRLTTRTKRCDKLGFLFCYMAFVTHYTIRKKHDEVAPQMQSFNISAENIRHDCSVQSNSPKYVDQTGSKLGHPIIWRMIKKNIYRLVNFETPKIHSLYFMLLFHGSEDLLCLFKWYICTHDIFFVSHLSGFNLWMNVFLPEIQDSKY